MPTWKISADQFNKVKSSSSESILISVFNHSSSQTSFQVDKSNYSTWDSQWSIWQLSWRLPGLYLFVDKEVQLASSNKFTFHEECRWLCYQHYMQDVRKQLFISYKPKWIILAFKDNLHYSIFAGQHIRRLYA